jgi:hypothetical protein
MRHYRPAIPKINPLARMFNSSVVHREAKRADPVYRTKQFKTWRKIVIERAGARCQAVDDGRRCHRAAPHHRMFADHVKELQDGGAAFDPQNGMCVCASHHTIKTMRERATRLGSRGG